MGEKYLDDVQAKEAILEIGRRMYTRGYVAANDGNISVKVGDHGIWITPTMVSKGYMTDEMLIKMDLDGNISEGHAKPSSEFRMHLRVYRENPEICAVTHAHPPVATSFAVAGIPLDTPILPEAVINLGEVPVAPYASPGTDEVPDSIAPYCKSHNAVLLKNHGALTWGRDPFEAYFRLESLEFYATVTMYTRNILGKQIALNDDQIQTLMATYGRK